jgi:hypothetical protein
LVARRRVRKAVPARSRDPRRAQGVFWAVARPGCAGNLRGLGRSGLTAADGYLRALLVEAQAHGYILSAAQI